MSIRYPFVTLVIWFNVEPALAMCDIGVRFSSVRLTSILAFMSIQWLIRWSHYIYESQIDMQHGQTVGHQNGKGWVIYYQVVCVCVGGTFSFESPRFYDPPPPHPSLSPDIFSARSPPHTHISDKKTLMNPPPPHLPSATFTHITILPVLCPSHLNQTCLKHKEHLFTFCRFIIHAARLMVCLYFCTS